MLELTRMNGFFTNIHDKMQDEILSINGFFERFLLS